MVKAIGFVLWISKMSLLAGYAVAAFLPLLYQSIPNPIGLHWYVTHRGAPMPTSLERKAFTVSSMIPVFQLLALGGLLWILLRRAGASASALGWQLENWRAMTLLGILAGCGWVALMALMVFALLAPSKDRFAQHKFIQRPPAYWIPVSLTAALVEEVWRAFCLISLGPMGQVHAMGVTAVAFGLAHAQSLGRAVSTTACALWLGMLFLWTGSLVAPIVAHAIVNLGTMGLVRFIHSRDRARPLQRSRRL
jgi:membrane protease YdiL (CAAX protease family)